MYQHIWPSCNIPDPQQESPPPNVTLHMARQARLHVESTQAEIIRPLTWLVTVESNGVMEVDASARPRLISLFLHEPQQKGGTDRYRVLPCDHVWPVSTGIDECTPMTPACVLCDLKRP